MTFVREVTRTRGEDETLKYARAGMYVDEWGKDNSFENVEAVFAAWL